MSQKPAFHEHYTREETLEVGSDRSFCFVVGGVLFAIAAYHLWHGGMAGYVWLAFAAPLLALGVLKPSLAHPLNRQWMKLGALLARLTNPVFLMLIYVVSIVPIGLILRVLGKDPMRRKLDKAAPTYWQARDDSQQSSMTNQF